VTVTAVIVGGLCIVGGLYVTVTAVIVGGLLILTIIIMIIMFAVYRMRKRDEGSYSLDDPIVGQKHSGSGYTKALMADQEFYA